MSEAKKHGIEKLTDYQHNRLRTEMYLGARTIHNQQVLLLSEKGYELVEMGWTPAAFTAWREAADNATDELLGHKAGDKIWFEYDENTKIITVEDSGRGIPFEFDSAHGLNIATMVLSQTKTGRNFGERGEVGGTNGLGISVVNNCSEWFEATIKRDGKIFKQRFTEGLLHDDLNILEPEIKPYKGKDTGTRISFKLSTKVFGDYALPESLIRSRAFELAQNNPELTVFYNGTKIKRGNYIPKDKSFSIHIDDEASGFRSSWTIIPNFVKDGHFFHTDVNRIPTFAGGDHVQSFFHGFGNGMLDVQAKESKRRKLPITKPDIMEGLLILGNITMRGPNFDSQSKIRLLNDDIQKIIRKYLGDLQHLTLIAKKNRWWVEEIYQRCIQRMHLIDEDERKKEDKKAAKVKIAKLIDANSKNRLETILFIMEGDSAKGNLPAARDPNIHAYLPLRGKIMNVFGKSVSQAMDSEALADIANAIGLKRSAKAVREELRYGKLYIAHDMDPDGFNIGAQLVNYLFTYWPELFTDKTNPFVYVFMTPFIIAEKGDKRKYFYGDDNSYVPSDYKNWEITRAKGLGSLEVHHWEDTLANPKILGIVDDGKRLVTDEKSELAEALDLIFNKGRADDRKDWMGAHK